MEGKPGILEKQPWMMSITLLQKKEKQAMILAKSITEARENCTHIRHPDGRESWVYRFFTASADAPDQPVAFLVEKKANGIVPPHFHEVNQFQVIAEGDGKLGKQDVQPFSMHYTNGFTGYGPITAADDGISFFTLRNRFDSGAKYFPQDRPLMKPAPKRHRLVGPEPLSLAEALKSRETTALETLLDTEPDGLASWFLRLGPNATTQTPSPEQGGGQYLIVAGGTLVYDGTELPKLSVVYISPDEGSITLQAGPEGLEALMMQFPIAEAYAPASTPQ